MDYPLFAGLLSTLGVIASGAVLLITFRRAALNRSPWARYFDAPLTTALFVISILTLLPALVVNDPSYVAIGRFAVSVIRGVVVAISLYLLGHYWAIRETWLP